MIIRYMEIPEIQEVLDIWLDVNLEVHTMIDPNYWKQNIESVKEGM